MSSNSSPPADGAKGVDLKHMTSNSLLSPTAALSTVTSPTRDGGAQRGNRRSSQQIRTDRIGSAGSIPSSPTSVHSSSSAIFERDIEPIVIPSPTSPARPLDPHRIPRARTTEQLEQAVPSVLDSAAAILATLDDDKQQQQQQHQSSSPPLSTSPASPTDQVHVVAPAGYTTSLLTLGRSSGFASPLSFRSRSRSPSPTPMVRAPFRSASGTSAASSPRANAAALASTTIVDSNKSAATTAETPTSASPPQSFPPSSYHPAPAAASTSTSTTSHPPSPRAPTKRLSFMSYADLITSTPATTLALSTLTREASAMDPPPHIPSVSGLNLRSAAAASVHTTSAAPSLYNYGGGGGSTTASLRGFSLGSNHPGAKCDAASMALMDSVGGEWERERMGMGLEERLDVAASIAADAAGYAAGSPVVGVVGLPPPSKA